MEAKEAVRYLKAMKRFYSENDAEKMKDFIEALDDAILAVSPPIGAGQMRWIYLPDADLMPYEHLNQMRPIEDTMERYKDSIEDGNKDMAVSMTVEEIDLIETALAVYKTVLMDIHKDRICEGLEKTVAALGEAQKEGRLDSE